MQARNQFVLICLKLEFHKIELQNSIRRLRFLCCLPDVKILWIGRRENRVKMSVAMVCRRREILKLDFLKCSKTVPKNEVWTRKYAIKLLEIMYLFRIIWLKVSKSTKTSKKDNSFYNTLSLEKPHSFYEPQLTRHCRKYTPAIQPKTCFL